MLYFNTSLWSLVFLLVDPLPGNQQNLNISLMFKHHRVLVILKLLEASLKLKIPTLIEIQVWHVFKEHVYKFYIFTIIKKQDIQPGMEPNTSGQGHNMKLKHIYLVSQIFAAVAKVPGLLKEDNALSQFSRHHFHKCHQLPE